MKTLNQLIEERVRRGELSYISLAPSHGKDSVTWRVVYRGASAGVHVMTEHSDPVRALADALKGRVATQDNRSEDSEFG